ncbi:hypothetical protein O181_040428 [Austropuccinia psidii MF-1]|uniref:Uncharacterized protein n=1 Tax=Austropuccinia psidii MF-1 TaxID=1389203 RepID=A0A9Q3DH68_9BASI|nr:hypothetical protein [Austropuccinia psidii MF-1]
MAPIQHINPLLFITDTLTERNTSAPNLDTPNLTSRDSAIGQHARSHVRESGLYQTMVSDNESLKEYDIGDEDYVVAEDNGLGMDDVTPPKRARSSVKRRRVQSNVYDYFEVSHDVQVKLAPLLTYSLIVFGIIKETQSQWQMDQNQGELSIHLQMLPLQVSNQNVVKVYQIHAEALFWVVSRWQSLVAIRPTSTNTMVDVLGVSTHGLVKHLARLIQTWVQSLQRKNKNPS